MAAPARATLAPRTASHRFISHRVSSHHSGFILLRATPHQRAAHLLARHSRLPTHRRHDRSEALALSTRRIDRAQGEVAPCALLRSCFRIAQARVGGGQIHRGDDRHGCGPDPSKYYTAAWSASCGRFTARRTQATRDLDCRFLGMRTQAAQHMVHLEVGPARAATPLHLFMLCGRMGLCSARAL